MTKTSDEKDYPFCGCQNTPVGVIPCDYHKKLLDQRNQADWERSNLKKEEPYVK